MLTFLIPAFNEAQHIGRCLDSISRHVPPEIGHETIVLDNGSTDETAALATELGALVLESHAGTIGGVRNEGVITSEGDILVFLDADCTLTVEWESRIHRTIEVVQSHPLILAGSQVTPPGGEAVFLYEHWFVPFSQRASALGSAHMICSRETFDDLGGFDESLETGEDHDFCMRLLARGGKIIDDPILRVEHYGYPRTWRGFFRRERWHGRGDATSLRVFLSSKVALTSTAFATCLLLSALSLILGRGGASLVWGGLAVAIVAVVSMIRFRTSPLSTRIASMLILPVYFLARSVSVIDAAASKARPGRAGASSRQREELPRPKDHTSPS